MAAAEERGNRKKQVIGARRRGSESARACEK